MFIKCICRQRWRHVLKIFLCVVTFVGGEEGWWLRPAAVCGCRTSPFHPSPTEHRLLHQCSQYSEKQFHSCIAVYQRTGVAA